MQLDEAYFFELGRQACLDGSSSDDNPFLGQKDGYKFSDERKLWFDGFFTARSEARLPHLLKDTPNGS